MLPDLSAKETDIFIKIPIEIQLIILYWTAFKHLLRGRALLSNLKGWNYRDSLDKSLARINAEEAAQGMLQN